ncbi:MAG TPA: gas vesicle protein [Actinophytocola sp.]|jgi:hypothetical protein|uniref:gas vesicle protein n=1 Tax=Actinophytocola sp. TaxID=1872138 RepID=UPI002F92B0E2
MATTAQPLSVPQSTTPSTAPSREPSNLGDILERVLDKGLVIAGDIRVNLLDIELLTIKLRLVVASLETAKEVGIDWWEHDPWLAGGDRRLELENEQLRNRVAELEAGHDDVPELEETAEQAPKPRRKSS